MGRAGPLGNKAAQAIAQTAGDRQGHRTLTAVAAVGDHADPPLVEEAVGKGHTVQRAQLRPVKGIGLLHLGDDGGAVGEGDGLTGLVLDPGDQMGLDVAVGVILAVGHQHMAGGRDILADDNGGTTGVFIHGPHK